MTMGGTIREITAFFKTGIWQVTRNDVTPVRYFMYDILKKLLLTVELFTTKRTTAAAAALTYNSLLAIVPILAVMFAIARGFGFNKYIEEWFRDAFASQPQVADILIGFVNSYLVHTKSGVFLGIGLLFMLWTLLMLLKNIEKSFNDIWQVQKSRSIYRSLTDYLAMFLLLPIIIVVTSGMSILAATVADDIDEYFLLGPLMRFILDVMPYAVMSAVFVGIYMFIPNTTVKLQSAIVPGIVAGVAMQCLQFMYIHSQIWVSSYNAIYGSFAALPLFILWVQISWTICLLGAELCFTNQNMEEFAFRANAGDLSHSCRISLCAQIMSIVCHRFENCQRPLTALEIKAATDIPIRIVHELLFSLTSVNMLSEVAAENGEGSVAYQPAVSLEHLTMGTLIDRLEAAGKGGSDIRLIQEDGALWRKVRRLRSEYIEEQRGILLKDLCGEQEHGARAFVAVSQADEDREGDSQDESINK